MATGDTRAKVRRAFFVQKRKIKAIARDLKLARNTVGEIVRAEHPKAGSPTNAYSHSTPKTNHRPLRDGQRGSGNGCSLGNSGLNQPMRQRHLPQFSGDWEHSEEN